MPNERWQADVTHYRLAGGADAEILTWLDDCSRYALHISAHQRVSGPAVLAAFRQTVARFGVPASTLTDNGMVFTTRLSGGKGGRNALEAELRRLHVRQKNSRPNHPTTCGKVERFQQTMKNWLAAQPGQPVDLAELQALLDVFGGVYNHHRPHRSLPHRATPAAIYTTRPKATPGANRDHDTHDRVRNDVIDRSGTVSLRVGGRLHHVGVGRALAGTRVLILVHDLDVRVLNAATGELLRELVLDPTRDYQPTGNHDAAPNATTPNPREGSGLFACPERSQVATVVDANPQTVWDALMAVDLIEVGRRKPLVGALVVLRMLPELASDLLLGERPPAAPERLRVRETAEAPADQGGWVLLGERAADEIALGLVGKFWRPVISYVAVTAEQFRDFAEPGYVKTLYSLSVHPLAKGGSLLSGVMRTATTDEHARRCFIAIGRSGSARAPRARRWRARADARGCRAARRLGPTADRVGGL